MANVANKAFLLFELVKRDVFARYRGSLLGVFWSFLTPLILLSVYSFVFIFIFAARFGGTGTSAHAVLMIFSGLIIHAFFSESIIRATTIISSSPNLVKKVVFPLWALPYSVVISALVNLLISCFILAAAVFVIQGLEWFSVLSILILIPLLMAALGLAMFFAATGVYLRDISHIIGLVTTILLFISPVFFARETAPEFIRDFLVFNPITIPIEALRNLIIDNKLPNFMELSLYSLASMLVFLFGSLWFAKTSKGFADVV